MQTILVLKANKGKQRYKRLRENKMDNKTTIHRQSTDDPSTVDTNTRAGVIFSSLITSLHTFSVNMTNAVGTKRTLRRGASNYAPDFHLRSATQKYRCMYI